MGYVIKVLFFCCIQLFSICLFAQTDEVKPTQEVALPARGPVKPLRELSKNVPWPKIEINAESAFQSEAQFSSLTQDEKVSAVLAYCYEASKTYASRAKVLLQVKITSEYFLYSCGSLTFRLKTGDYLKQYNLVKNINPLMLNVLDTAYGYIYNQPHYEFWKTGEEYTSSYKSSVFGTLGLPMRYYFIVMQISVLLAVGVSIVAVLRR